MNIKVFLYSLLLTFTSYTICNAANDNIPTLMLSLDSCSAMALKNNVEIKKAELTVEKTQYEKNALFSMYFPKISAIGGITYVFQDPQIMQSIEGFIPPMEITDASIPDVILRLLNDQLSSIRTEIINAWTPINISLKGAYMAGLTLVQPIFAGGRIVTGNAMAKLGKTMAEDNLKLKKEDAYLDAIQSYLLYVSVQEKVKLAQAYDNLLNEVEAMLKNVESVDMINRNDLLKVQVQRNDVQLKLSQAKNGLELSRMALCHIIGVDYDTNIIPTDTISKTPEFLPFYPDSAVLNRIEYRLLNNLVEMKNKEVKLLMGEYMPSVGLAATYGYMGGVKIMDNAEKPYNISNVMATVNIPITNWWEGSQKIKSAKIDKKIAELELQDKTKLLELQIKQASFNIMEAYKQLNNSKFALEQAEESLRIATDRYKIQLDPIIGILNAQADWQSAYSNMIDAHINYQLKEVEFFKATAQLQLTM